MYPGPSILLFSIVRVVILVILSLADWLEQLVVAIRVTENDSSQWMVLLGVLLAQSPFAHLSGACTGTGATKTQLSLKLRWTALRAKSGGTGRECSAEWQIQGRQLRLSRPPSAIATRAG